MKPKIRFVLWNTHNREGDFEFLCSTQSHVTVSLALIKQEYEEAVQEFRKHERPCTDEDVKNNFNLVILKLTIEQVK